MHNNFFKTNPAKWGVRLTAAALSALLVLPLGVFAKNYPDVTPTTPYKEQIDILSDIGVILGTPEGTFKPEDKVTREQMALLLFRLMLAREDAGNVNSTAFTDLYNETYHGAISWANASGYILGTSETTFDPKGEITLQDAFAMIVRALGASGADANKGYPWTYIDAASKLNLDEGLEDVGYTQTLTRGQVAAVLFNALTADYRIPHTLPGGGTGFETTTVIEKVFGYKLSQGSVIATNMLALHGSTPVIKTGHVSVSMQDGKTVTVPFADLGLSGTPEQWLGKEVKVIYSEEKNGNVTVLGASYTGSSKLITDASVSSDGRYLIADGVKYLVVENRSPILSTNANELQVFVNDGKNTLTQVKNTAELAAKLGFYSLELIFDGESTVAERAVLKSLSFGQLQSNDGKLNIADNLTEQQLIGGLYNTVGAVSGDYVLYHFNRDTKRLEIAERLNILSGQVTKLTADTATIGGVTYQLGVSGAGITAESIRNQLQVGQQVHMITRGNTVIALTEQAAVTEQASYLILLSAPVPVFSDGSFRYVASAHVGGKIQNIFLTAADAGRAPGQVYRYVDMNGTMALIDAGSVGFVAAGDLSHSGHVIKDTTVTKGDKAYLTLEGVNFVTDAATVIVLKNGENFEVRTGVFAHSMKLAENAAFTAILHDELGSTETLRFLYVDGGQFETVETGKGAVKILAPLGMELIDGRIVTEYSVYVFATGKVEKRYSAHNNLVTGSSYTAADSGMITNAAATVASGVIEGFTGSTVTIGGSTYAIAEAAAIMRLTADQSGLTAVATSLDQIFGSTVEFTVSNGAVTGMLVIG